MSAPKERAKPERARPPVDLWSVAVGSRPHTLRVEERVDCGLEVQLRWQTPDPANPGKYLRNYVLTGLKVRDDRGRLRAELKKVALAAAEKAQALHAAGLDPRGWNKSTTAAGAVPRTLSAAFAEALPDKENIAHTGTLYAVRDRQALQTRRGADYVLQHLGDLEWERVQAGNVVELWQAMARTYAAGKGPGWRSLRRAIGALYQVWAHMLERHGDGFPPIRRPLKMGKRMRSDWLKVTGEDIALIKKERKKILRYTKSELEKLFQGFEGTRTITRTRGWEKKGKRVVTLIVPACDPRVRTIVEIGAELRHGQVLRAMRSHLNMSPVGTYGLGRFYGSRLGYETKPGQDVDLHPELRAYLDEVLHRGYLSDLEQAYQDGAISDYPLYPGGKLVDGRIPVRRIQAHPTRPLSQSQAIKFWREYETHVGVDHIDGRSFYGLRRALTDVARDYNDDPRVLNKLTGHTNSKTREEIYMDDARDEDQAGAARTRRSYRLDLAGQSVPEEDGETEDQEQTTTELGVIDLAARLMELDPEVREHLLAMLHGAGA